MTLVSVPPDVARALDVWLAHHDRIARSVIEGLYVVGSIALDDHQATSDVDIVAFTADPADPADPADDAVAAMLAAAHDATRAELDGVTIDGPRLAWADVSEPPTPAVRPWTLDGAFHHDSECFEVNPVTWFTLANHGIAVRGVPAAQLDVHVDVDAMRAFVRGNVDTYWRSVGEQIVRALADPTRDVSDPVLLQWCALGVARMMFTTVTGTVASKSVAGEWAATELPAHAEVLRVAVDLRAGRPSAAAIDRQIFAAVAALVGDVVARVAG